MVNTFDYRRFYDRLAWIYGPMARLWWPYTAQALPWLPAQGPVLEIGPGPGYLLAAMARRVPAVGVDLSWAMLRQAQKRLARAGVQAGLVQGDACALPFPSQTFQAVVLTFAFSAIPNGLEAMEEMVRVLVPGGRVVLVDAGVPEDRNPVALGLARLWERFGAHMRDETILMAQAGLQVVVRKEFGPWRCMRVVVGHRPERSNPELAGTDRRG